MSEKSHHPINKRALLTPAKNNARCGAENTTGIRTPWQAVRESRKKQQRRVRMQAAAR
jgi:hypothetical protein